MDTNEEIRYLLLAVQREGNRQFVEALRPLNLTPAQSEVIMILQQYTSLTLLQLGQRLVCESGSPSRLVTAMVKAKWVEKKPNPDDGRAVLLSLTPQAKAILPQLNEIDRTFNQRVGENVPENLQEPLLALLRTYVQDSESGEAIELRKNNK